jgi:3-phosphoshikimate 1-carboxyvinyltransferase
MANGHSVIRGVDFSQDVLATMDCLRAMGTDIFAYGHEVHVQGGFLPVGRENVCLPCRESGSTLRFMAPIALVSGKTVHLTGSEYLFNRPLSVYEQLSCEKGFLFEREDGALTVRGPLPGGAYTVPGDVSSQFISGLLFALPMTGERCRIHILPPVESRSYLDLTVAALSDFGIRWRWQDAYTLATEDVKPVSRDVTVEGDESNAAFFHAMKALGHDVQVEGLRPDTLQGDRVSKSLLEKLQAGHAVIDLADCPDLGPVLMMAAAALNGAEFVNTRRLRIKESDRAACMAQELEKCGAHITIEENRVLVHPAPLHAPHAPIDGHNDHRVVMAMAVLLTTLGGTIKGTHAVSKSYPGFFDDLKTLMGA